MIALTKDEKLVGLDRIESMGDDESEEGADGGDAGEESVGE